MTITEIQLAWFRRMYMPEVHKDWTDKSRLKIVQEQYNYSIVINITCGIVHLN